MHKHRHGRHNSSGCKVTNYFSYKHNFICKKWFTADSQPFFTASAAYHTHRAGTPSVEIKHAVLYPQEVPCRHGGRPVVTMTRTPPAVYVPYSLTVSAGSIVYDLNISPSLTLSYTPWSLPVRQPYILCGPACRHLQLWAQPPTSHPEPT